jgi:hypothetical protein
MPSIPGYPQPEPPRQPTADCFDLPAYYEFLFAANRALCEFLVNLSGGGDSITVERECRAFDADFTGQGILLTPSAQVDAGCKLTVQGVVEVCLTGNWIGNNDDFEDQTIQVPIELRCDGTTFYTRDVAVRMIAPTGGASTTQDCGTRTLLAAQSFASMGKPLPADGVITVHTGTPNVPQVNGLNNALVTSSSAEILTRITCTQELGA